MRPRNTHTDHGSAGHATKGQATREEAAERQRLSVVIPMYNEARRMRRSLPELLAYFDKQSYPWEMLIVDDGSTDGTPTLARELLGGRKNTRVLVQRQNRGKGHAVKMGMLAAAGEVVLFCDADLSTPPSELGRFWQWFDKGYDVVIGSRKMRGSNIERHQPAWREKLGKVFTWLTNTIATKNLSDVTCGFKCFTHAAAQELFSRSVIDDWSFDAEVLFIAQRRQCRIKEVPVTWHDEPGTKVRIVKDAYRSVLGLLRIRLNSLRGRYD